MVLNETFVMNNGVEIPKLSLGTWQIPDEVAEASVLSALKVGYRHIDTAVIYRNEAGVGRGIASSNVPRENIFVTTKVPDRVKDPIEVERIFNESLERLGVDYVDLLLIHAPKAWEEIVEKTTKTYYEENLTVWGVMERLYKEGKCRSIGVSNFEIHDIQNLLDHAEIKPQVNQIKVHIGYYPKDLVDYCQANDILVEAYSPNATGKLRENPVVVAMAEKYGVSIPQLGIRFDLQLGTLPLPKTTHEEYMVENAAVDFEISEEDMEQLKSFGHITCLGD